MFSFCFLFWGVVLSVELFKPAAMWMFSVSPSWWHGYLDEAHADSAHLGELVDGLKAIVHRLSQQLCKLLVIEDLEAAAAGDLAHSGGVEAVVVVAVSALNEDAGVTQALGIDLSTDIVKVNSCTAARRQLGTPLSICGCWEWKRGHKHILYYNSITELCL